MWEKITQTWSLMQSSWEILNRDKEIIIFPLISGICCLLILATFVLPFYDGGTWDIPDLENMPLDRQIAYYLYLFLFYFCNYFVITFFNSAVVACALIRMRGGNPTVMNGFQFAVARIHLILGWAVVAASVGLLLRIVEDRAKKIGSLVAGLLGLAWTVASFLVVPILVVEDIGPIAALKRSTALLRKTWGEQLVSHFSFGLIFGLLMLPAVGIMFLGIASGSTAGAMSFIFVAIIYVIILALVQSALQTIFQTALYVYARKRWVPRGFNERELKTALSQK